MANINKIYQESNVVGGQSREEIDAINKMRAEERDRRRRLSAFMRQQRKADEDGFFSAEEQQAAREEFARMEEEQESEEEKAKILNAIFDIKKTEHESELDANKRLIPQKGLGADKFVGTDADRKLVFKSSTFPGDPYSSGDENKIFIVKDTNTSGSGDPVLEVVCDFLRWV